MRTLKCCRAERRWWKSITRQRLCLLFTNKKKVAEQIRGRIRRRRVYSERKDILNMYNDAELVKRYRLDRAGILLMTDFFARCHYTTNRKKLDVVSKWPGSVHDSRIWNECGLKRGFENGSVPGSCHLIGDSGYPCQPWLLTPYLEPRTEAQEAYNRYSVAYCFTFCWLVC